jgi:hypothetical protein
MYFISGGQFSRNAPNKAEICNILNTTPKVAPLKPPDPVLTIIKARVNINKAKITMSHSELCGHADKY